MASFVINGVGLTQKWSFVTDPAAWYSYATMPSGTPADPSGYRRQQVSSIAVAIAGVGGSKTYSVFMANSDGGARATSANYTVGSGSAATLQPTRSVIKNVTAGQTVRVGFNQVTSSIYVGRGEKAGINVTSESPSGYGWSGYSLYAVVYYSTLPSAPGTPTLTSTQANPGSISASWVAPGNNGGSTVTSYKLQYSKNSNFSNATTVTTTARSYTATGLAQGVVYYFRVAAINGVATAWGTTSAWSGSKSITASTNPAQVATPTFSPDQGSYVAGVTVTLASATPSTTLYYTTNGTTPTTGSTVYSAPISVTTTTTIKVLGVASGLTNSDISTAVITIVRMRRSNGSTWVNLLGLKVSDGKNWQPVSIQASNGTSWIDLI